jgi:hypothetical protein
VVAHGLPRQCAGLVVNRDGVSAALVDPAGGRRYVLNNTAAALWELCDGRTSPEEMVEALSLLFEAEVTTLIVDVDRVLDEFAGYGLIEWEPAT